MEAYQATLSKRDRREYVDRAIPADALHRILQAGRMAGSSSNSQPVRYVVMQDRANIQALIPFGRGTSPLKTAPLFILALLKDGARDFDVGRSFQNMMVTAWAEGIASCPVGLQDPAANGAINLPEGYTISIGVAFGYPVAGDPPPSRGPRLALDELYHQERW